MTERTTDILTSYMVCDHEDCPIVEKCPVGPVPHMPCPLKEQYSGYVDRTMNRIVDSSLNPEETSFRVATLLKPLFDQLLSLRIADLGRRSVYAGAKANPVLREVRQTIQVINTVLTETLKEASKEKPKPVLKDVKKGLMNKGYYDLLLQDGVKSVDTRVGPD